MLFDCGNFHQLRRTKVIENAITVFLLAVSLTKCECLLFSAYQSKVTHSEATSQLGWTRPDENKFGNVLAMIVLAICALTLMKELVSTMVSNPGSVLGCTRCPIAAQSLIET